MKMVLILVLMVFVLGACVPAPATETLTIYFLDENMFAVGTEPYEKSVSRVVPVQDNIWETTLEQLFLGPTEEEKALGLDSRPERHDRFHRF